MCEYTKRDYSCGHTKWIAARWCDEYIRTHRRCQPNIRNYEYRHDEVCGECRPHEPPAWENMITRRHGPQTAISYNGVNSVASIAAAAAARSSGGAGNGGGGSGSSGRGRSSL